MKERLEELEKLFFESLKAARTFAGVDNLKKKYLGRKGPLAELLKELAAMAEAERRAAGEATNQVKQRIQDETEKTLSGFQKTEKTDRKSKRLNSSPGS